MKTFILLASLMASVVSATGTCESTEKSEDVEAKEKEQEQEQKQK
ncbi:MULTISPECIES: hypothetical protein [Holospora]|uniref:Uncharacterized protein n=2 Tax=Holospora TaxID=44747 RepID=A0A061JHW4_9PROT|nr:MULTISPECIES: hypothetical protein [Holospora]ETZ05087.1 hypothetical protein K737_300491 [Holospora undulata HU1]GAJ46596.1 hypothetical protein HE1_00931 [Holospora elegans E1]